LADSRGRRWVIFDRSKQAYLPIHVRFAPEIDLSWAGSPDQLKKMYVLRRILNPMGTMDAIDFLLDKLRNTKNNSEFFDSMNT
jgi:transcription termination factor Rho